MTCEEKYRLEHGSSGMSVSTPGCPNDHGYLPTPDYCEWPFKYAQKCLDCWDREIPENNKTEKEKQEMKKHLNDSCAETAAYEEMEGEWTRTNVEATTTEEKEPTVAEIEAMMYELDRDYTKAMDELRSKLKEARRREEIQELANRAKMILDSYISAGFTREEAMAFIMAKIN